MGLLSARKRKIASSAQSHLEPGEEIRAMVMTQTGRSAMSSAARGPRASDVAEGAKDALGDEGKRGLDASTDSNAKVHAIAVTDANVYAFWIPAWTKVGGVRSKSPIATADLSLDGKVLRLDGVDYHVLFFGGKDAQAVADRAGATQARPQG